MAKNGEDRLKLVPLTNPSGERVWRITGMMPDGTRLRRNYKTKSAALVELADLEDKLAGTRYVGDMSDHGIFRENGVPYFFLS